MTASPGRTSVSLRQTSLTGKRGSSMPQQCERERAGLEGTTASASALRAAHAERQVHTTGGHGRGHELLGFISAIGVHVECEANLSQREAA